MDHKIDQQLRSLFTKTFTELQPLIDIIPMSGNVIYQMADGQQPVPITNGQPNFFPSTQVFSYLIVIDLDWNICYAVKKC